MPHTPSDSHTGSQTDSLTDLQSTSTSSLLSASQRIVALESNVIDQIAAGEVVERPAHLIKELVENSLDAGADDIHIEFASGGRDVTVTDNGSGIHASDLKLALHRHATSKIAKSDDLWKLSTFGFRGEALASISAVAKVTLSSRQDGVELGSQIQAEFGQISGLVNLGHAKGTRVQVHELFQNMPARLKFLKSPGAESAQIKVVLKALALANPGVSFKITQEGELLYYWPKVAERMERALTVLGVKKLFTGTAERGDVRAYALFSDPHEVSKTSKNMWFFAQGRWVQDRSMQAAVNEAYRNLLMHGEYPIVAVWVTCNPEQVDVNIHPTKSQVKFADPSLVFRAVQASIRDSLETAPWLAKSVTGVQIPREPLPETLSFAGQDLERVQYQQKEMPFSVGTPRDDFQIATQNPLNVNTLAQTTGAQNFRASEAVMPMSVRSEALRNLDPQYKTERTQWASLQVLGQAHLTYLVCQNNDSIVFVDQHAAHERVLFEKFMSHWKGSELEVQDYLFPICIDLAEDKVEALLLYEADIARLGIHLERMGPTTLGVRAAPLALKETALVKAIEKAASDCADHGGSLRIEKMVGDICATMACHSAIRAGQALSIDEMRALLVQMDQFPMSSFCPHGRPVSVPYAFYQLEKDFGRIV